MTPKKRRVYILGLFLVFVIVIPFVVLYSSGYRLNSKFRLVKTGGIYFHNNEADAVVRINGKIKKRSGMFEKNLLVRDLKPAIYYVRVEKDGYRAWEKNITVQEQMVEVCYPLLIPVDLKRESVPKTLLIEPEKKGSRPKRESNEEYSDVMELFKTYDKPSKSVIPGWVDSDIKKLKLGADRRLMKKVFLFRHENKIFVRWTGSDDQRPFFISSTGNRLVFAPDKKILSFGFFPDREDSVVVLLDDGTLFAMEIDRRFNIQNMYKIASNCSRFAVSDELLYFFSGGVLYRIDFDR